MKKEALRAAYEQLDLTQNETARFVGADPRTFRRWASGDWPVPVDVALLLTLMTTYDVTPDEARKLGALPKQDPEKPKADRDSMHTTTAMISMIIASRKVPADFVKKELRAAMRDVENH